LNRCLDNAIADAVTEFGFHRDRDMASKYAASATEEKGVFAHELRNFLHTAQMAFDATKSGNLPLSGATGAVLARSLAGLKLLVDRSLAEVRHETQDGQPAEEFSLAGFIDEMRAAGALAAKMRGCVFIVAAVDPTLSIRGKRELLFSAVWNLLQNAFKFTHIDTEVSIIARSSGDRILIDVTDHCGGIAPAELVTIFDAFSQSGTDRSGLGLGLAIAQKCVSEHDGTLTVVNTEGVGCTFTINLPRYTMVS
jgi:signal transduction histidine kinase